MHRNAKKCVIIVDDDAGVREAVAAALRNQDYAIASFASADEFLRSPPQQGCVLADVCMPGTDGIELQMEIRRRGLGLPVVLMTGQGDVPLAVRAIKAGAADFIQKPFSIKTLLEALDGAFLASREAAPAVSEGMIELFASLTQREKDILAKIATGLSNKEAAMELGISPRTVEFHRANMMRKTNARNLADLVRIQTAMEAAEQGHAFAVPPFFPRPRRDP